MGVCGGGGGGRGGVGVKEYNKLFIVLLYNITLYT
jgi:hypothetical protein